MKKLVSSSSKILSFCLAMGFCAVALSSSTASAETPICITGPLLADKVIFFTSNRDRANKVVAFGNGFYSYNSSCVLIKTGCLFAKHSIAITENWFAADEVWFDSHDTSDTSQGCY